MLFRLAVATMTLATLAPLAGCSQSADDGAAENAALATPVPPGMVRGTVLETMNSGGYTYVFMDTGEDQRWVAAIETPVQVDDVVQTDQGMPMTGFTSKTLDRTFNVVYFVASLQNLSTDAQTAAPAAGQVPPGHPPIGGEAESAVAAVEAYEEG